VVGKESFASLQSVVSFLVGLVSLSGAVYSAVRFVKPSPATGEVLAVVRVANTDRALPGSAIEVLTLQDALIATLAANDDGSARRVLAEGAYRVRVTAPHFRAQTREVQVQRGGTAEVRFALAPVSDGGAHPVSRTVGAAQRFLHGLGL
jgi:hypothetical protein